MDSDRVSVSSDYSDAQIEWDESCHQIMTILSNLVFPLLGRLVGRKVAHSLYIEVISRWSLQK
ncbi:hypothetical protein V1511DRAFT_506795 [Dipodascopsis uninucleata]